MAEIVFSRSPSTKAQIRIETAGLVAADDTLVIVAKKLEAGTAIVGKALQIENYGDPVAALAECTPLFGAASEITEMVVSAIKAVQSTDLPTKMFPKLVVIPMAHDSVNTAVETVLAENLNLPMPFVALAYPLTDTVAMTALRTHLRAISGGDRGRNGQFGSFGFMATDAALATAAPAGEAAGDVTILGPWLRDTDAVKKNKIHQVAAAVAAVCAANGIPYLPLNDTVVGGLIPPAKTTDFHSEGDTGSAALGLESGLMPLMVSAKGEIQISRSVTTKRVEANTPDKSYFDLQDWQVLYYLWKQVYYLSREPRYKNAKMTDDKIQALLSEIIATCKTLEAAPFNMVQRVDELMSSFGWKRSDLNRSAAIYEIPVNVVPGFHNKGMNIIGTDKFDVLT
ncbi:hypothetical protein [Bdellovibrio bacteriovorus]|uniref:hypothetical protein n=1 Tax=Bdellovibrio bacteriovorus TaxID=959 RepID=UPI003AA9126A